LETVFCGLGSGFLNIIYMSFGVQRACVVAQVVCHHDVAIDFRLVHVRFVVDKVVLGHIPLQVIQFSIVSIIPAVLHTHQQTSGQSLGIFRQGNAVVEI
jgi:hypothetical protein